MEARGVKRFTVSVPPELLNRFDLTVQDMGYDRSKAIGLAMSNFLAEYAWEEKESRIGAGALSLVYDHERRQADRELTEIQHHHRDIIISTTHVHLDRRNCLLIIAVKGKVKSIQELARRIMGSSGVRQLRITTLAV